MQNVIKILLFVGLLGYGLPLPAATIRVPADQPTIQAGIDAALAGDTVLVAAGTYKGTGNKNIDFKGKAITVRSETGAKQCIIDCEGEGRGFNFQSGEGPNSVLRGFTIQNGRMDRAGGIFCADSSPVIRYCIIRNNTAYDSNSGGIFCSNSSAKISDCTITGNTSSMWGGGIGCFDSAPVIMNCIISYNVSQYWWGGGIVSYNSNPQIINCVISENESSSKAGGLYCNNSSPTIVNSNFIHNISGEEPGGMYFYQSNPVIVNSILRDNHPNEIAIGSGTDISVRYSIVSGGWAGEGNMDVNPIFVDLEKSDFHLKNYSPCIGAGTPDGISSNDIEGNPRPNPSGSNPDIGAYENPRAFRAAPPMDVFALDADNEWFYEGTNEGNPYTVARKVIVDSSAFPITTYAHEIRADGVFVGKEYYAKSSNQVLLWGATVEDEGVVYDMRVSKGLPVAWSPLSVGDHRNSAASAFFTQFPEYTFNASMDVLVMALETVTLGFDTLEAYKVRYKMRLWSSDFDITDTFFWWFVPYIGVIKDGVDADSMVKLSAFTIGGGTISHLSDADGDGLKDYEELLTYKTDWQNQDTDHDLMPDKWEVDNGLDPLKDDAFEDADGDGFFNLREYQMGKDPKNPSSHPSRGLPLLTLLLDD